jgi:hypothetical protein
MGFSLVVLVVMAIGGLPFFFCKYNTSMETKSSAFAFQNTSSMHERAHECFS